MEVSRISMDPRADGFAKSLDMDDRHKNSNEQFLWRKLFAIAPFGLAIVRLNGFYKEANPAILKLNGSNESELKQLQILDINHDDDVAKNKYLLEKLVKSELKNYQFEKRILTKSRESVWVRKSVGLGVMKGEARE